MHSDFNFDEENIELEDFGFDHGSIEDNFEDEDGLNKKKDIDEDDIDLW